MKKLLLTLLILSFLGGEVLRVTFSGSISVRLLDIVTGGIFLMTLIDLVRFTKRRQLFLTPPAKWLGGFLLVAFLSLIINSFFYTLPQLFESSLYLLRFLIYSSVLFYTSHLSKDERAFESKLLTAMGSLLVIVGFIQYFYYNNLRNLYYLGWDDHMYRIFSVFLDPNFTGILFTLFALFLMGRLWEEREMKKKHFFFLLSLLLGLTLVGVVMTFSRSALISLGVGTIIFLSLIGRKRYLIYFFSVILGMLLLATPFFYIENVNLFREVSSVARIESAKNAILIIKDHFITGVGFNAYRYAQIQYGFRRGDGAEVSHADSGTDNSYLFVLATTGILGIICYLGLLRSLVLTAWERYIKKQSLPAIVFIASLLAVMIDSFFINSLFYPFVMIWLFLQWGRVSYS